MISKQELFELADLCKLSFDDQQGDDFLKEFNSILELVERIKEVDTEGVEPTYQLNQYTNPVIEDEVAESLPVEEVVKNTAEEKYGFFKILKVVD